MDSALKAFDLDRVEDLGIVAMEGLKSVRGLELEVDANECKFKTLKGRWFERIPLSEKINIDKTNEKYNDICMERNRIIIFPIHVVDSEKRKLRVDCLYRNCSVFAESPSKWLMSDSKIAWSKSYDKEKKKTFRSAIRMIHKGPCGNTVDAVIATSAGYPL